MTEAYQRCQAILIRAQQNLNRTQQFLDLHSHIDPARADWGLVGDLAHVEELLDEIVQFIDGELAGGQR